jgi:hypothetical protein
LGYVKGQNIVVEFGLAQSAGLLPDMAAALARLKVDVLVALERRRSCRPRMPKARGELGISQVSHDQREEKSAIGAQFRILFTGH